MLQIVFILAVGWNIWSREFRELRADPFKVNGKKQHLFKYTNCLLSVHALIEIFKLQFAFFLSTGLTDAMATLDPLLLKGMAACSSLVRLLPALGQDPLVQVNSQPRLKVNKWHGSRK